MALLVKMVLVKTTLIRHIVGAYQGDYGFVELEGMRVYENSEAKSKVSIHS